MENPNKQIVRDVVVFILGSVIGFLPGLIRLDQAARQIKFERAESAKQIADLQGKLANLVNSNANARQVAIDSGKYRTLLITNGAPMPHREFVGVEDPWSHIDIGLTSGTIWVIPGLVQPHTLHPDDRAAWAVVSPDGHVGRWLQGAVDYTLTEASR